MHPQGFTLLEQLQVHDLSLSGSYGVRRFERGFIGLYSSFIGFDRVRCVFFAIS